MGTGRGWEERGSTTPPRPRLASSTGPRNAHPRGFGNHALSAGLSRSVSGQVRRVSPGVCVAQRGRKGRRQGRGGSGGGRRPRGRRKEQRGELRDRHSCSRCRSCPGRIAKRATDKHRTLGRRAPPVMDVRLFSYLGIFVGGVVVIDVSHPCIHTSRGRGCTRASWAGDLE